MNPENQITHEELTEAFNRFAVGAIVAGASPFYVGRALVEVGATYSLNSKDYSCDGRHVSMNEDNNFTFEEIASGVDTFVLQASAAGAEAIVIADALVAVGLALAAAETKLDADDLVRRYVSERDKT